MESQGQSRRRSKAQRKNKDEYLSQRSLDFPKLKREASQKCQPRFSQKCFADALRLGLRRCLLIARE